MLKKMPLEKNIAPILILLYVILSFFNYSIIDEDAFIYFRSVENTISGNGYAFNPGIRIESCSSIIWYGFLCLLGAAGINLLTASKLLGIACGCLSIILTVAITKRFTPRLPWLLLPSLLTLLTPSFIFRNQMGLETPLYCLVFQLLVFVCLEKNRFKYWPLPALMLATTRPEGLFLLLGLLPAFFIYKPDKKSTLYSVGLLLAPLTVIFIARFIYFHDFLPSPFYIKVYPNKFITGLKYLHNFLTLSYLYAFIIPVGFLAVFQRWNQKKKILLCFIAVFYAWVVLAGADDKPFYRHCLPALPLIFIFGTMAIKNFSSRQNVRIKTLIAGLLVLFACVSLFCTTSRELFTFPFKTVVPNPVTSNLKDFLNSPRSYLALCINRIKDPARYNHIKHSKEILIGEFIKQNYPEDSTIVYDQMGQAPYTAGMRYFFIDTWGLLDKRIGRFYFRQGSQNSSILKLYDHFSQQTITRIFPETTFFASQQDAVDYVLEHDPEVIMITALLLYFPEKVPNGLFSDKRFLKNYILKYSIEDWVCVFEKRNLAAKPFYAPPELKIRTGEDSFTPWERYPQIMQFKP